MQIDMKENKHIFISLLINAYKQKQRRRGIQILYIYNIISFLSCHLFQVLLLSSSLPRFFTCRLQKQKSVRNDVHVCFSYVHRMKKCELYVYSICATQVSMQLPPHTRYVHTLLNGPIFFLFFLLFSFFSTSTFALVFANSYHLAI